VSANLNLYFIFAVCIFYCISILLAILHDVCFYVGLGGRIILKCMLRKLDSRMWTAFIWLRLETNSGPL
jgi:hypothetical protein